jgi:enamine deaminase RidA (YjgF/YER057c/UK114 family)
VATDRVRRLSQVEGVATPRGPYSQVTVAGSAVHVAGQVAVDANGDLVGRDDFPAQARQVYSNLGAALAAVGCGWQDVLKLTVYLTDMANLSEDSRARREVIDPESYPASTAVEVSGLADPAWMIEVEAVARLVE